MILQWVGIERLDSCGVRYNLLEEFSKHSCDTLCDYQLLTEGESAPPRFKPSSYNMNEDKNRVSVISVVLHVNKSYESSLLN
jgi:hypothetical protein